MTRVNVTEEMAKRSVWIAIKAILEANLVNNEPSYKNVGCCIVVLAAADNDAGHEVIFRQDMGDQKFWKKAHDWIALKKAPSFWRDGCEDKIFEGASSCWTGTRKEGIAVVCAGEYKPKVSRTLCDIAVGLLTASSAQRE